MDMYMYSRQSEVGLHIFNCFISSHIKMSSLCFDDLEWAMVPYILDS